MPQDRVEAVGLLAHPRPRRLGVRLQGLPDGGPARSLYPAFRAFRGEAHATGRTCAAPPCTVSWRLHQHLGLWGHIGSRLDGRWVTGGPAEAATQGRPLLAGSCHTRAGERPAPCRRGALPRQPTAASARYPAAPRRSQTRSRRSTVRRRHAPPRLFRTRFARRTPAARSSKGRRPAGERRSDRVGVRRLRHTGCHRARVAREPATSAPLTLSPLHGRRRRRGRRTGHSRMRTARLNLGRAPRPTPLTACSLHPRLRQRFRTPVPRQSLLDETGQRCAAPFACQEHSRQP
jgi:hypothetical protein